MAVELQTVTVSFALVKNVENIRYYIICLPNLRSLVPSSVSDVGNTKAPFWVRSGGYLPLSASRLTLQSSPVPFDENAILDILLKVSNKNRINVFCL